MITLAKLGDDVREDRPGAGMTNGSGPLRMIGGMPTVKVNGPLIRVSGGVYAGRPIRWVSIEPVTETAGQAVLIAADGTGHTYGDAGAITELRDDWIRRTITDGTYAGIARMR